jgi:succinate dehydrogenase / fumarate reductase cytochrome b subunit
MSDGDVVDRSGPNILQAALQFLRSSIGAKFLMAITGGGLWLFVIVHLIGNLQILQSAHAINEYGVTLRKIPAVLWGIRGLLLAGLVIHVWMGIRLARMNREARGPVGYRKRRDLKTTLMARTMALGGLVVLAFIILHLSHFTLGFGPMQNVFHLTDSDGRHDVFRMVVLSFKNPVIVAIYVIGQLVLLSHLYHASQSLWQSLGVRHPIWTPIIRIAGRALATLIFAGNVGLPLAIYLFWDTPPAT